MTDFLTNKNTAEFELNFSADPLDFDLQNHAIPTFFDGIIHTLSSPTLCTMFNFITTFDHAAPMQFVDKEKESKEELKFQFQKLQHKYLALLIQCSTIYC